MTTMRRSRLEMILVLPRETQIDLGPHPERQLRISHRPDESHRIQTPLYLPRL
jgi:hypothetical protein